jgi:hypothetical protein
MRTCMFPSLLDAKVFHHRRIDVGHAGAIAPDFGRIAGQFHLELLHGVHIRAHLRGGSRGVAVVKPAWS